jgi:phage N-6-adenine-methyltransferase
LSNIAPVTNSGRGIEQFKPGSHRLKVAALEYGIDEAKRIKDWPALEKAVEGKIEEQHKFVAWWDANVRDAGQPSKELSGIADNSLSALEAEKITGMKPRRVSDLRKSLNNGELYRQLLIGPEYRRAHLREGDARTLLNQGEVEWYTPARYIDMAREVLGGIDLDPASGEMAQRTVRAKKWYSRDDSSLPHEWHGRVWMNPPYSTPLINQMMTKLVQEYKAERVTAAIVLVNSCTEVKWFQEAGAVCQAICFPERRIKFLDPEGREAGPLQGQTFFYLGIKTDVFADIFGNIGLIVVPWGANGAARAAW